MSPRSNGAVEHQTQPADLRLTRQEPIKVFDSASRSYADVGRHLADAWAGSIAMSLTQSGSRCISTRAATVKPHLTSPRTAPSTPISSLLSAHRLTIETSDHRTTQEFSNASQTIDHEAQRQSSSFMTFMTQTLHDASSCGFRIEDPDRAPSRNLCTP
jgi:hypothetical protein